MNPHRILTMQSGGWIGDMVLLTPALRALRERWPDAEIALLVRPLVATLMASHPYVDRLLVYDKRGQHRGIRMLLQWARALRSYDLALVWHPTSIRSALLPWLARIPVRVGSDVSGRGAFLTHRVPHRNDRHEVERYLDTLVPLGIRVSHPRLEYWHQESHRRTVAAWFQSHHLDPARPLVAIHPDTTWPSKRWPPERFAQVADRLVAEANVQVVLVGGPNVHPLAQRIRERMRRACLDGVGQWNLLEFGAFLERCDLLLSCDSGPMHIAAAVGIPVVALFGPTSPHRHRPYGEGHVVLSHPVPCAPCYRRECPHARECMESIGVEEVVFAIRKRLNC